jgi:hypothetical protein
LKLIILSFLDDFRTPNGQTQLEVQLDHETVWLTQAQMAELFAVSRPNVTTHLRNVL